MDDLKFHKYCVIHNKPIPFGVSAHRFPLNDEVRLTQWIATTGKGSDWRPTENHLICGKHFPESMKSLGSGSEAESVRTLLVDDAVPTLELHEGQDDDEPHEEMMNYNETEDNFIDMNCNPEILANIKTEFEIDDQIQEEFNTLSALVETFDIKNIFFIGSFGLFYAHTMSQPDLQDSVCSDGRLSDSRLTILISTSVASCEKPPVLIVSSAKANQSFLNVGKMFVKISQESRSWITVGNLKEHLNILDKQFAKQNRKVLFIADKSIPHQCNIDQHLKNIKLAFIPHSTLSPFQSGIVNKIKTAYRDKITENEHDEITLQKSMEWLVESWNSISANLIRNCCLETKLFKNLEHSCDPDDEDDDGEFEKPKGFDEFVNCDNFLFTHDPVSVEMDNNPDNEMEFKQEFVPLSISVSKLTSTVKKENEDESAVVIVELSDGEDDVDESKLNLPNRVKILEQCVLTCMQQNKILRCGFIDDERTIEEIISAAASHLNFTFDSNEIYDKWFRAFIKRNHIQFDTQPEANPMWTKEITEKIRGRFSPENTFFIGEFAFHYNLQPVKDSDVELKKFTVLMGVNLKGNKRLPLFVIGAESANGQKFTPTQYIRSPDGNIKKEIFQKYVESLDTNAVKSCSRFLVLCDHSLIHAIPDETFKQVILNPLPPTIVSPIELLSTYIKFSYRQNFIKNDHHNGDIQLADAMNFMTDTWKTLKVSFISAMLKSSGWIDKSESEEISAENQGMTYDPIVEFDYQLIENKFDSFMDFVREDDNLMFYESESILEICNAIDALKKDHHVQVATFPTARKISLNPRDKLKQILAKKQILPVVPESVPNVAVRAKRVAAIAAPRYAKLLPEPKRQKIQQPDFVPPKPREVIQRFNMENLKQSAHPYHDLGVIKWIEFAKNNNIEITNVKLRVKAQKIAEKLDIKGFNASKKWLQRFKTRHEVNDEFLLSPKVPDRKVVGSEDRDIFTFCTFSLFFKSTPSNCSVKIQPQSIQSADNFTDERFTVFFCANKSGTEKLPMIVIGQRKIQSASFFKNQQVFKYFIHPKAIMTRSLFETQLLFIDRKFQYEKRNVHFIVKAGEHCQSTLQHKLKNINLVFESSSDKLPFEGGIVNSLKTAYRTAVIQREMLAQENGYVSEPINTFEAVSMLHDACQKIDKNQLSAAFKTFTTVDTNSKDQKTEEDFGVLNECFNDFDDFIRFDDFAPTC